MMLQVPGLGVGRIVITNDNELRRTICASICSQNNLPFVLETSRGVHIPFTNEYSKGGGI